MTGLTIGTLFSGGEGVGVGARMAGVQHAWGIESDAGIAGVARDNGFYVDVADVRQVNPATYAPVDVLHASPPCLTASQASAAASRRARRVGSRETAGDYELAEAIVRFLRHLMPRFFTLENVYGYRKYRAFGLIVSTLHALGYTWSWRHINAADYGVPQTRKRLILIADRRERPRFPNPTHTDSVAPMLDTRSPWVGWLSAVSDIIDTMASDEFAPWQMERLPASLSTCLVDSAGYPGRDGGRTPVIRRPGEPANTIVANHSRRPMRAFIVDCQFSGTAGRRRGITVRHADEPIFTVTASQNKRVLRASLSGHVVRINARGMARFQAFPDDYVLPEDGGLAIRVIGNAVPPLLYRRIVESWAIGEAGDISQEILFRQTTEGRNV